MINDNENKAEMKSISQRYDVLWPRPRHWHKYTIFKMCPSTMMVIYIKQHLKVNSWEVKQHWGWVEEKVLVLKKTIQPGCSSCTANTR